MIYVALFDLGFKTNGMGVIINSVRLVIFEYILETLIEIMCGIFGLICKYRTDVNFSS